MMNNKIRIIKYVMLYSILIFLCLLSLEISFRIKGFYWKYERESEIIMDDDIIGWVNRPGVYMLEGNQVTILNDGSRIKHKAEGKRPIKVLLIGGSSVFGWRIPDHQTFAWILEESMPNVSFSNYAVNGHSTFQSLLLLEKLLNKEPLPNFLIYGYEDLSDLRNVADLSWLKALTKSRQSLPFVTLDQSNQLIRHAPYSYPLFPLMKFSAAIAFFQERYLRRNSQIRDSQAEFVTQKLILEMDRLCKERGIKFIFTFLDGTENRKNYLRKFLAENDITFVDCVNSGYQARNSSMLLENDFHPNILVNSYWADCLERYFRDNIKALK